jgi:hypothetical protein
MVTSKQINSAPAKYTTVGMMNALHGKYPADTRRPAMGG